MDDADLRLDGNAAAGLLNAIFPFEMTANWTTCAGCGAERQVGALLAYAHGMGAILRCPACEAAQIRIVEAPGRYWLDLRGVRVMQIRTV